MVPCAPQSSAQFSDPWIRRVRDVDDHTLAGLLRTLLALRRMKFAMAFGGAGLGALAFGFLPVADPLYAALIYGTLACAVGLPLFAVSSLSVRWLFLKESLRHGLSVSASVLVLTRAERRARFMNPTASTDHKVELLLRAVREPDRA